MVERHKYERIASQPHERTLRRWRKQEEEHRAHVAGMGNIETMFRRMAEKRKESVDENQLSVIETLTYESKDERGKRKMKEDLAMLEKMLKSKRCEVTGEDRERHEMIRDFMKLKLKDWETPRKQCAYRGEEKGVG